MKPAIEADGLSRAFGETKALEDLSLRVGEGEMVALLGPDGAGKTTAMRLLAGVLHPDSGMARLGGIDMGQRPEEARAQLGYVSQKFGLYAELTAMENLRFLAEVRGLGGAGWRTRAEELLQFVGLESFQDRRAAALSGGMRQKLGLAAALLHRPRVLLLDEPTGGVDPLARQGFWRLLVTLLREGVAILISTPYMDEAARCHRVGFLHHGRLLVEGTPAQLRAELEERMVEVEAAEPDRMKGWVGGIDGIEEAQVFGATLRLRVAPGSAQRVVEQVRTAAHRAGMAEATVRVAAPSLEDVFRFLLQQGGRGALP
jgi:ABC-2 type transport system ATP-binding protein